MTVTNQNRIYKEIRSSLNLGNACHHAVQNLLSSWLLSRNIKIKIYKNAPVPVVMATAWSNWSYIAAGYCYTINPWD
jgi:hypothetical protein